MASLSVLPHPLPAWTVRHLGLCVRASREICVLGKHLSTAPRDLCRSSIRLRGSAVLPVSTSVCRFGGGAEMIVVWCLDCVHQLYMCSCEITTVRRVMFCRRFVVLYIIIHNLVSMSFADLSCTTTKDFVMQQIVTRPQSRINCGSAGRSTSPSRCQSCATPVHTTCMCTPRPY